MITNPCNNSCRGLDKQRLKLLQFCVFEFYRIAIFVVMATWGTMLMISAFQVIHLARGAAVLKGPGPVVSDAISVTCIPADARSSVELAMECDRQQDTCMGLLTGAPPNVNASLCYCSAQSGKGSALTAYEENHLYLRSSATTSFTQGVHYFQ